MVSDSSPLILYARVGRLDQLRELFAELLVPLSVVAEIEAGGGTRAGALELSAATWIKTVPVRSASPPGELRARLGEGEADAIRLALAVGGPVLVLMDDRDGRRAARGHGLDVLGSAGAPVLAKGVGLVGAVQPVLDELRLAGLFLSGGVYQDVLVRAGEA